MFISTLETDYIITYDVFFCIVCGLHTYFLDYSRYFTDETLILYIDKNILCL